MRDLINRKIAVFERVKRVILQKLPVTIWIATFLEIFLDIFQTLRTIL